MRTVSVGSVVLGEGRPKICVPLTAENLTQLESQAHAVAAEPAADLVEWRADWYRDLEKPDGIWEGMRLLRSCLASGNLGHAGEILDRLEENTAALGGLGVLHRYTGNPILDTVLTQAAARAASPLPTI